MEKGLGIEVADYSNNMVNQGEDEDTDYNNIDDLLSEADVLAMIKTLNKGKKGKIVYKVLIEDTPKVKRTRENLQINIDQDLGASTLEIGTIKRKRQKK
ncbi:2740_t:CDS:2 [Entrophospora sp. SA101]|nr:2740_t:CDS:2 [Entrophospora sp. SA101]